MKFSNTTLPLACCLILAGINLYQWQKPDPSLTDQKIQTGTIDFPAPTRQKNKSVQALEAFEAIVERPLFVADRKPVSSISDTKPGHTDSRRPTRTARPIQHKLIAIIITAEDRIALLHKQREAEPEYLRTGDTIDGWRLEKINEQHLVLTRGDQSQQLMLTVEPSLATLDNEQQMTTSTD